MPSPGYSIFALTDAFFVSRLGTDAVATVGLTEAMISILFAVAIAVPPLPEKAVAQAPLLHVQKLLAWDDGIGIDIGPVEGGHNAGVGGEWLHDDSFH
mgnify:CR=1 FL=1